MNGIYKRMIHFKEIIESKVVPISETPDQLFKQIDFYLDHSNYQLCPEKQQKLIVDLISLSNESWPNRFKNFLHYTFDNS